MIKFGPCGLETRDDTPLGDVGDPPVEGSLVVGVVAVVPAQGKPNQRTLRNRARVRGKDGGERGRNGLKVEKVSERKEGSQRGVHRGASAEPE